MDTDKSQDGASLALHGGTLNVSGTNIKSSANAKNLKSVESANALLNLREKISQNTALVSDEWLDRLLKWAQEHCYSGLMVLSNFPNDKERLREAKSLTFSVEYSFDDLPDDFVNLRNLEDLRFENFDFKQLPKNICKLTWLKSLSVSDWDGDHFALALPSEFGALQALERLYLCDYDLFDFPKIICELKNLKELHLSACALNALPDELSRLEKLEFLNVSENYFSEFPKVITKLTTLKGLQIHWCGLNELPDELLNLQKLQRLDLWNNDFFEFPQVLCELSELKELNIANCGFSTLPKEFANLQKLQKLDLGGKKGGFKFHFDEFPSVILELPSLKTLLIESSLIKGKTAQILEKRGVKINKEYF